MALKHPKDELVLAIVRALPDPREITAISVTQDDDDFVDFSWGTRMFRTVLPKGYTVEKDGDGVWEFTKTARLIGSIVERNLAEARSAPDPGPPDKK